MLKNVTDVTDVIVNKNNDQKLTACT